jgi:hypothetical protein
MQMMATTQSVVRVWIVIYSEFFQRHCGSRKLPDLGEFLRKVLLRGQEEQGWFATASKPTGRCWIQKVREDPTGSYRRGSHGMQHAMACRIPGIPQRNPPEAPTFISGRAAHAVDIWVNRVGTIHLNHPIHSWKINTWASGRKRVCWFRVQLSTLPPSSK